MTIIVATGSNSVDAMSRVWLLGGCRRIFNDFLKIMRGLSIAKFLVFCADLEWLGFLRVCEFLLSKEETIDSLLRRIMTLNRIWKKAEDILENVEYTLTLSPLSGFASARQEQKRL